MAVTGASLTPIYDRLHAVSGYHPGGSELFSDPSLRAGDIVSIVQDGVTYQTPVMVNRTVWKGGFISTVDSSGEKKRPPVEKMAQRKYSGGGGYKASGRFSSMIEKQNDKISLVVTEQDGHNVINSASIVLGINSYATGQSGSYVKISADAVDIVGILTAQTVHSIVMQVLELDANQLVATDTETDTLICTQTASFAQLQVYDSQVAKTATWMSKTVVTSATITMPSISRSSSRYFLYSDASGNLTPTHTQTGRVITSYTEGSVSVNTDTIYYLGSSTAPQ